MCSCCVLTWSLAQQVLAISWDSGHCPNVCNNVYVISKCKCECVPFQLQDNLAQARRSFEAGGSTRTVCLNCFLPLNSNAQTRYLLNRKRHLYCILQVLPVHVYACFTNIPFLPLGSRLEWEGSYDWILDFGMFVYGLLGNKMRGDLRSGLSETWLLFLFLFTWHCL